MNIAQAKKIPIEDVIDRQGHGDNFAYDKKGGLELWYRSPFRDENTPSFKIDTAKNKFNDYGTGTSGDTLNYVCEYYSEDVKGGLQRLKQIFGSKPPKIKKRASQPLNLATMPRYKIDKVQGLYEKALYYYLRERGINTDIAKKHLKQINFTDTINKNALYGFGIQNLSEGWEVRNKIAHTALGKKDISVIEDENNSGRIHIFEGQLDALTFLTASLPHSPRGTIIILNSTAMAKKALAYLDEEKPSQVILWLDNDEAGTIATQKLLEYSGEVGTMNYLYAGHNDLNAWHMHNIEHDQPSTILTIEPQTTIDQAELDGWKGNRITADGLNAWKEKNKEITKSEKSFEDRDTNEPQTPVLKNGKGKKPLPPR